MGLELLMFTIVLFVLMLLYVRVAAKFNVFDSPNSRSSHVKSTITGGGIIFPIAMLCCFLAFSTVRSETYAWLLSGMLVVSIVSFWDDIVALPIRVRIVVHLIAVTVLLAATSVFSSLFWIWIPLVYIVVIGTLNAYNFMDGINGMTGLYSLAVLIACFYFSEKNGSIVQPTYIHAAIAACAVFLFFNFRTKAVMFAGDVGSIGLGFWVISILLLLIVHTESLKFVLFLSVYGVDAALTILYRLKAGQNIFRPHRLHLYQLLSNEGSMHQLVVALCYALLQSLINFVVIASDLELSTLVVLVCSPMIAIYLLVRRSILKTKM